ncbi:MAG: hypothetical protein ACYCQM_08060 [Acidithiobacillus sp.]
MNSRIASPQGAPKLDRSSPCRMPNIDCTFRNPDTNILSNLTDFMRGRTNCAPGILGFALQRHAIGVPHYRERKTDHHRQ